MSSADPWKKLEKTADSVEQDLHEMIFSVNFVMVEKWVRSHWTPQNR
jgi:hypothetical protein